MEVGIRAIYILTKARNKQAYELGIKIHDWLQQKGVSSQVQVNEEYTHCLPFDDPLPDMILVLGGDGTILSVARKFKEVAVPLLGLNLGQVGFLTELTLNDWQSELQEVLSNKYNLSSRIMLDYKVFRKGEVLDHGRVVNDLVIGRAGMARLIKLHLKYGQDDMGQVRADGLIVSTPVGSTAYAVAAGGPLIGPELEVMEICPVCPFLSNFRPIILPSNGDLVINIESSSTEAFLTLDGQSGYPLEPGDKIEIRQAMQKLLFAVPYQSSYIEKLKLKGYI